MAPKRRRSTRRSTRMAPPIQGKQELLPRIPDEVMAPPIQGKQELLPRIPDEVTMTHIATKLDWSTFMMLQMVSREWRHVIRSRNVYNDRKLSKTNKAYLLLVYSTAWHNAELVFSLFSCRDGFIQKLPPIPGVTIRWNADVEAFDCVCLDGKIYAWVSAYPSNATWRKTYVLDLAAGDGKWSARGKNRKCTHRNDFGHGVLDGKIYKFRGDTHAGIGVLDTNGRLQRLSIEEKVLNRPQMEMYDPDGDVWSLITPEPLLKTTGRMTDLKRYLLRADISQGDPLEHHLSSFSKWAEEQSAMDPSTMLLTNGRYEPFFSEWRRKISTDGSTSSASDGHRKEEVATQVYYLNTKVLGHPRYRVGDEILVFFEGNLLKHMSDYTTKDPPVFDIQIYDTQTSTWKHWKSFSFSIRPQNQYPSSYRVVELASVNNTIWAIVQVSFVNQFEGLCYLVRSPELLSEDHDEPIGWIDVGYWFRLTNCRKIRPISL